MESCQIDYLKDNIINWYDFKKDANLLGIGAHIQEYSNSLNAKLSKVILIEDFTSNFETEEKFDYILIKDEIEKIEQLKKYLKQDGTILLLLDNRFGMRYFAGDIRNNQAFSTICKESENLFSKKEIEDLLEKQGFSNYKFFYPLPNYKIANAIFSDDYLPDYTDTKLICNNIYNKESTLVFDEMEALKQVTKSGEFQFFANSYFVEINPKTEVKFASFNNTRKSEYRLCTKIYSDYVEKLATNLEAQNHISNMKKYISDLTEHGMEIIDKPQQDTIVSTYITEQSLYQIMIKNITDGKIEDTYQLIEKWYDFLKDKFEKDRTNYLNENIEIKNDLLDELCIVKKAYIDLVFENTFLINNQFTFFDQEWCIDNLPLEFILYRGINNIYIYHPEIENILPRSEFLNRFKLLKYLEVFISIEEFIQTTIIDEKLNDYYNNSKKIIHHFGSIENISKQNDELFQKVNLLKEEDKKKEDYIEELTQKLGATNELVDSLRQEDKKKENYITSLQQTNQEKDKAIDELKQIAQKREEIIDQLNEIIKVKENQISIYENMRAVKLAKKLRGLKNGHE